MERMIRHLVVGTSLHEIDDAVVKTGLALANQTGASIRFVHAYTVPVPYVGVAPAEIAIQPSYEPLERLCRDRLADQLERVGGDPDLASGAWLDIGAPHRIILDAARDLPADLILLGPHAGSQTAARWLGSTADRVLRKAEVPVWVVRGDGEHWPRRALAPVDLSPLSKECLEHGLRVVHETVPACPVIDALFVMSRIDREGGVHFTPEQVDRFAREEFDRFLADLERPAGIEPEARLTVGLPREEILETVDLKAVDLVIVGTHGRSGFERLVLGSVAADVAREAPCSVLVIPPAAAREQSAVEKLGDRQAQRLLISETLGPASQGRYQAV